jgi:hypothetical protein
MGSCDRDHSSAASRGPKNFSLKQWMHHQLPPHSAQMIRAQAGHGLCPSGDPNLVSLSLCSSDTLHRESKAGALCSVLQLATCASPFLAHLHQEPFCSEKTSKASPIPPSRRLQQQHKVTFPLPRTTQAAQHPHPRGQGCFSHSMTVTLITSPVCHAYRWSPVTVLSFGENPSQGGKWWAGRPASKLSLGKKVVRPTSSDHMGGGLLTDPLGAFC